MGAARSFPQGGSQFFKGVGEDPENMPTNIHLSRLRLLLLMKNFQFLLLIVFNIFPSFFNF
jgi:hypothetical protein